MNELYLVPSVPKYALPILDGKKTYKAFFRKNAQSFFDFPVSREDRFFSVKLLLFRLQSIRKILRRLVFLL